LLFPEQYQSLKVHSKALIRTPTEPLIDIDSTCINRLSTMVDSIGANISSTARARNGSGITRQYAMYLEFNGEVDGCGSYQERMKRVKKASIATGEDASK
jgi:hypothetical protein